MELEEYRQHIAPLIYECLEQLQTKINDNNDVISHHTWKELVTLVMYKDLSITNAFTMFLNTNKAMPNHEEYRTIIMTMFRKYERNQMRS